MRLLSNKYVLYYGPPMADVSTEDSFMNDAFTSELASLASVRTARH